MKLDSWFIRDDSPMLMEGNWKAYLEAEKRKKEPSARSITCPQCGRTSWHPKDVEHGWCGNCYAFTTPGRH